MALTESAPVTRGRTVVWLRGVHNGLTVALLSETFAREIAHDDTDLVVDLSGVQSIGSATVRVISRAHEFLRLQSRSLILRSPSSSTRRVLQRCGLADLLEPRRAVPRAGP
jgi:anti-anti-sigma factor